MEGVCATALQGDRPSTVIKIMPSGGGVLDGEGARGGDNPQDDMGRGIQGGPIAGGPHETLYGFTG